jgi:hypothetical protein
MAVFSVEESIISLPEEGLIILRVLFRAFSVIIAIKKLCMCWKKVVKNCACVGKL